MFTVKVKILYAKNYKSWDNLDRAKDRYERKGWENVLEECCCCSGCIEESDEFAHDFVLFVKKNED